MSQPPPIVAVAPTQIFPKANLPSQDPPTAAPAVVAAPTQSPAKPNPPPQIPPTPVQAPPVSRAAEANKGVTFTNPVVLSNNGAAMVGVLGTNTTDQVKSFIAKATFKVGDRIVATAIGACNDLRQGETRGISMVSIETIPVKYDSVRVDVDMMIGEARSTKGAMAAAKFRFGPPKVKTQSGFSTVDVDVTNGDTVAHTALVQAAFSRVGQLMGIGTGAVNDISPG